MLISNFSSTTEFLSHGVLQRVPLGRTVVVGGMHPKAFREVLIDRRISCEIIMKKCAQEEYYHAEETPCKLWCQVPALRKS